MQEAVNDTRSRDEITPLTSVQYLKGVGPARAAVFAKLGIHTAGDLLEYFPRDWVFAPDRMRIAQMKPNEPGTVAGLVESID